MQVRTLGFEKRASRLVSGSVPTWLMLCCAASAFLFMSSIFVTSSVGGYISAELGGNVGMAWIMVPSITAPLALSTYLSDKTASFFGESKIIIFSFIALPLSVLCLSFSSSLAGFIACRIISGLMFGNLLPIVFRLALAYFAFERRHLSIMIIVLAMAAAISYAPVLGWIGYKKLGWREELRILGVLAYIPLILSVYHRFSLPMDLVSMEKKGGENWNGSAKLSKGGSLCMLIFILLNGLSHSGLLLWTSTLFIQEIDLLPDIPAVLLPYVILTLILFGWLGMMVSRGLSRTRIECMGLAIIGVYILATLLNAPMWLTIAATIFLSIGYNITQPLFFGMAASIENTVDESTAVRMGCSFLFAGYSLGPLLSSALVRYGNLSILLFAVLLIACLATISRTICQDWE